jgi:uncharacterized OB-fold protein
MSDAAAPVTGSLPALSIPSPDDAVSSAQWWGWLRRHELRVQRCVSCGVTRNPPSEVCHACAATAVEWLQLTPLGSVVTWTRVWHPVNDEMQGHTPYLVAWVEVDHPDRPRFLGNLTGDPFQDVRIGDGVTGVFEDRPGGTILNWSRNGR